MSELAWSVVLAVSSVIVGVASLWALFRPMAAGTARKAADQLKEELKGNEFHEVGQRFNRLDAQIARLDSRVNNRVDRLDVRVTELRTEMRSDFASMRSEFASEFASIRSELASEFRSVRSDFGSETRSLRSELNQMHETQGRILEALRAISPVGNQG